jgi:hypothetical protein
MSNRPEPFRNFAAALVALALAACSTPETVRDLAEKTAANTAFVSRQLTDLSADNLHIAELRARNIARLNQANRQVQARHAFDLLLIEKTESSAILSTQKDLQAWNDKVQDVLTVAADAEEKEVKILLAAQTRMDDKSTELNAVAKALARLAEEDDLKTRAAFIAGYVKEVGSLVKEARKTSEKSADNAASGAENAVASAESPVTGPEK